MYIYSRWNVNWWPNDRCAGSKLEWMLKIIYSSLHETATSHIVNTEIVLHVRQYESIMSTLTFDRIHCQDGVVLAALSI